MINAKAMLAGVMGDPVSHSHSPRLHNRWIAEHNLNAVYIPLHVKAADLADAFRLLPKMGFRGWNVTVPHKVAALSLVQKLDAAAEVIGAVNTVVVQDDGTLLGRNTDAAGFIQNLKAEAEDLEPYKGKAVVLGAGGAARAILYALEVEGFQDIVIINRTEARAQALAKAMRVRVAPWKTLDKELEGTSLLVNATTLGQVGEPPLVLHISALPKTALVADIVYIPHETELLKSAFAHGCATASGFGMLIRQGVPGFEAWFGVKPQITHDLETFLLS